MATDQPNAGDALIDLPSSRCVNLTTKISVTPGEDPQEETSVAAVVLFVLRCSVCCFQGLQRLWA